jgi:hypothetical protein
MRIRIMGSRLEPTLAEMGVFQQALPAALAVSKRTTWASRSGDASFGK